MKAKKKVNKEDNTPEKEKARVFLSQEIDNYFDGEPYSMLELLGSGIGAEFFLANQKSMTKISCVDNDPIKIQNWTSLKLDPLKLLYPTKKIETFFIDLNKFYVLAAKQQTRYDVINLDTMQYCGPKEYSKAAQRIPVFTQLESIFQNQVITDNGLLLLNVIVNGWKTIACKKHIDLICRTQNEILDLVAEAADNYGFDIDTTNATGLTYKPGGPGWTEMYHNVIPVSKR